MFDEIKDMRNILKEGIPAILQCLQKAEAVLPKVESAIQKIEAFLEKAEDKTPPPAA